MKEWKSYPKPEPKPKKDKVKQWDELKMRAIKKRLEKKKVIHTDDDIFYRNCYAHFTTSGLWECENCGSVLKKFNPLDKDFTFEVRKHFHHLLSKAKFPALRHEIENIGVLCFPCHSKCESSISYPRMKIYPVYEDRKKQLLK